MLSESAVIFTNYGIYIVSMIFVFVVIGFVVTCFAALSNLVLGSLDFILDAKNGHLSEVRPCMPHKRSSQQSDQPEVQVAVAQIDYAYYDQPQYEQPQYEQPYYDQAQYEYPYEEYAPYEQPLYDQQQFNEKQASDDQ